MRHADYLTTNEYKHRRCVIHCKKEAESKHVESCFLPNSPMFAWKWMSEQPTKIEIISSGDSLI